MKSPLTRIRQGAICLGVILVVATCGYRLFVFDSWIESLFMVVITVSSVGFSESSNLAPGIQLFTIAVIVFGISATAYTIGGFLQMMTEGEIDRVLGHRRMTRGIERLDAHVIICGFGRIGQNLAKELTRQHRPFVIVEHDLERVAEAREFEYLVISGDATEEDVLLAARVEQAETLVTGLPSDAANVFITLTSRNLNKDLMIIARGEYVTTEKKLLQAGANRVVMPAVIGAQRMATMMTRPSTADLMELVADRSILDVELDEFTVPKDNRLVGCTVRDAEAHRRHRLLFVAVKKPAGEMIFNPDADYAFGELDIAIVMGRVEDIASFRGEYGF
jgi:voltage-gated potassium channel